MNISPKLLAEIIALPMRRAKYINLVVDDATDVRSVADAISLVLPNPIHVGLGGQVSQGRNADVLPDEVFDLTSQPQTVIIEVYPDYKPSLLAQYLEFALDTNLPAETTVIFLNTGRSRRSGTWVLPFPIANKMFSYGITLETEAA